MDGWREGHIHICIYIHMHMHMYVFEYVYTYPIQSWYFPKSSPALASLHLKSFQESLHYTNHGVEYWLHSSTSRNMTELHDKIHGSPAASSS